MMIGEKAADLVLGVRRADELNTQSAVPPRPANI
uniref:Uncharacterized protein n=1 Tax=Mycobacterium riyadhense TaxID=486698 RepID=A0A653F0U3_9MYCO|nr:hypothetical protein BIN_B_04929 [Mycobacterium riyadhense]